MTLRMIRLTFLKATIRPSVTGIQIAISNDKKITGTDGQPFQVSVQCFVFISVARTSPFETEASGFPRHVGAERSLSVFFIAYQLTARVG
jgi:hypothetical protein